MLTLGFGLKVSGSGKVAKWKKTLGEEIAKGRSGATFWRGLQEATSEETGDRGKGGLDKDPRGQKRPREERDPRPSSKTCPALESHLLEVGTAREEGARLDGGSGGGTW